MTPPPPLGLQENAPAAANPAGRKRKEVSPAGKSGPLAKRAAAAVSTAAAPSGRAPAVPVPAEEKIWEAVAEETGWTVTDCLAHKVSFAKRADAKAKVGADSCLQACWLQPPCTCTTAAACPWPAGGGAGAARQAPARRGLAPV